MKRFIIISIVCLLSARSLSFGQNSRYAVEVNIGVGALCSFDKMGFDRLSPGMVLPYGEIRYVFRKSAFDVGLNVSVNGFDRYDSGGQAHAFLSRNYMVVSDYSFYEVKKMRLFGGIGAGLGSYDDNCDLRPGKGFCVMPRAGACFFGHLELTLGYLFEDRANSNLNFRVGYVF